MDIDPVPFRDVVSVTSLKQHVSIKIAEILINRNPSQFIYLASPSYLTEDIRNHRWKVYKAKLTRDISRLPIVQTLKSDIRDAVMSLFVNARDFMIFCKIKIKKRFLFTPIGDVDLDRMTWDFRRRIYPYLSYEKKLTFLAEACHLFQTVSIRSMLCEFLLMSVPFLEPVLRTAEVKLIVENRVCHLCFFLPGRTDPAIWSGFVSEFNRNNLHRVVFSFDQNVLKISIYRHFSFLEMKSLWPKMTELHRCEAAKVYLRAALNLTDTPALCHCVARLGWDATKELIKTEPLSFIFCFMKQPYDKYFIPALHMAWEFLSGYLYDCIIFKLLLEIAYEEGLSNTFQDILFIFYRYVSMRDAALAHEVLCSIELSYMCIMELLGLNLLTGRYLRDSITRVGAFNY